jgi:hypothetical protein
MLRFISVDGGRACQQCAEDRTLVLSGNMATQCSRYFNNLTSNVLRICSDCYSCCTRSLGFVVELRRFRLLRLFSVGCKMIVNNNLELISKKSIVFQLKALPGGSEKTMKTVNIIVSDRSGTWTRTFQTLRSVATHTAATLDQVSRIHIYISNVLPSNFVGSLFTCLHV